MASYLTQNISHTQLYILQRNIKISGYVLLVKVKKTIYINIGAEMLCFLIMLANFLTLFLMPTKQLGFNKIFGLKL